MRIRHRIPWALALCALAVPCFPGTLAVQAAEQQPVPAVAELELAFRQLEAEFSAAIAGHRQALQEAQAAGKPLPPTPAQAFFARFEALALAGQPDALRWSLGAIQGLSLPKEQLLVRKAALYERFVGAHADHPWASDVLGMLQKESDPVLGRLRAADLCLQLAARTTQDETRAAALLARAVLLLAGDAEQAGLGRQALAQAAELDQTASGQRAAARLFQIEHLSLGSTAADFTTTDVDGVEFKLSDYRGKVVVISFWGLWCPPCRAMIPHEKELVERHAKRPFAMLGINTDRDKQQFRKQAGELGINWRNSWQGGTSGELCRRWGVTRFPTIFVLDHKGVIRHLDLRGPPLSEAVEKLLAEAEAEAEAEAARR